MKSVDTLVEETTDQLQEVLGGLRMDIAMPAIFMLLMRVVHADPRAREPMRTSIIELDMLIEDLESRT